MNRREMLSAGTILGLGSMASAALAAADAPSAAHAEHQMLAGHEHHGSKFGDLVAASSECVATGDACLSHCLTLLGQGDKELATCAKTVRDTIAACTALRELAAADSPHVKALAKVVGAICGDCEAECKKHEKHEVCRNCELACRECKSLCEKTAAAA